MSLGEIITSGLARTGRRARIAAGRWKKRKKIPHEIREETEIGPAPLPLLSPFASVQILPRDRTEKEQ
jgi:hypothetical protein